MPGDGPVTAGPITPDHVVIVGGGFSGTLLAINLLRYDTLRVTLVERARTQVGKGLAYGAAGTGHVLNVRAANMSAFPDDPQHFVQWLDQQQAGAATSFATRAHYGIYLAGLLERARQEAGDRLTIMHDEAVALTGAHDRPTVTLASGGEVRGDTVILAPGNLPPHDLSAFAGFGAPTYFRDPWSPDLSEGLEADDTVLLLGSGLTAVDCILSLHSVGFMGRIVAMSRRGLMPHVHAAGPPLLPLGERPSGTGPALIRHVRARAALVGWRNAVDELRPHTQDIWRRAGLRARTRFLRHLRPYWDVHRHRIAPEVAERLSTMQAAGRLLLRAGKIVDAAPRPGGVDVIWRPRGDDAPQQLRAARVVNCTGPLGDLGRVEDALLRDLVARGTIRADALSIGIDVDGQGRALKADGTPNPRLFVAGPMTRGAHWEIVAVPDIRRQVWDLARYLTGSHWVGAEGL